MLTKPSTGQEEASGSPDELELASKGTSAATVAADGQSRPRSAFERGLGKLFILTTLISFLYVGVLLNLIQLILTLTIKLSNNKKWRSWHKRLHGQIVYAIFAQPVFLLYVWPRWKLNIVVDDMRLMEDIKKDMFALVIANHTFELDWMTCFILADQLGNMGNYKCFSKDELKWLPVIGWTFWMADLIYVKRDWRSDRLRIASKLNQLIDYDQVLLGIFAEGTRWTEEKYEDAVQFAKSRSIVPYKHHLFPRPRGFNYTMRHYLRLAAPKSADANFRPIRVFNLEIVMRDKPNFRTFLEGGLLRADVYCEEIKLNEDLLLEAVTSRDEDDCPKMTQMLKDIYRRKDQLVDEFYENGNKFVVKSNSSGGVYPLKRPVKAFIYWLAGMSLTYGSIARLAYRNIEDGSSLVNWTAMVVAIVAGGVLMLRRIQHESKPTKLRKRPTVVGEGHVLKQSKSPNSNELITNASEHIPTQR